MRMLTASVVTAILAVSNPRPAWGEGGATPGRTGPGEARTDVVQPDGRREIRTHEGFLRVEDPPGPDEASLVGSLTTYHPAAREGRAASRSLDATPAEAPPTLRREAMVDATGPAPTNEPCRAQRSRYLQRVLRMSGIDVERPLDLLDGLAGTGAQGGDVLAGGWVIPGFDAVKPLAWDQELRSLGRDLASCQARSGGVAAARPSP